MSEPLRKPTVAIVGSVGVPAKYGGFETLVEHLVATLQHEFRFIVYCSALAYRDRPTSYQGARLEYVWLSANGAASVFYDGVAILRAMWRADTILVLGVSGCLWLPLVRQVSRARIVVNIDGIEWKRDKWGKMAKAFLRLSERFAVRNAHAVISDNAVITRYVADRYRVASTTIAYGGDHAVHHAITSNTRASYPITQNAYAFAVCRIEPENNIHIILEAFANYGKLRLLIVGNWDASSYGRSLRETYVECGQIVMADPVYDLSILNMLRSNCHIYVHGHSCGGTNPSLVEAMHLGLAVCCFDVDYNRSTTENSALYFKDVDSLSQALANLHAVNTLKLGNTMREIAERNYMWGKITRSYSSLLRVKHIESPMIR